MPWVGANAAEVGESAGFGTYVPRREGAILFWLAFGGINYGLRSPQTIAARPRGLGGEMHDRCLVCW